MNLFTLFLLCALGLHSSSSVLGMNITTTPNLIELAKRTQTDVDAEITLLPKLKQRGLNELRDNPAFIKNLPLSEGTQERLIKQLLEDVSFDSFEFSQEEYTPLLKSLLCHDHELNEHYQFGPESTRTFSDEKSIFASPESCAPVFKARITDLRNGSHKSLFESRYQFSQLQCLPHCLAGIAGSQLFIGRYENGETMTWNLEEPRVLGCKDNILCVASGSTMMCLSLKSLEFSDKKITLPENEPIEHMIFCSLDDSFVLVGKRGSCSFHNKYFEIQGYFPGTSPLKNFWVDAAQSKLIILWESGKIDLYQKFHNDIWKKQGITPDNFKEDYQGLCFTPQGDLVCSRKKGTGGIVFIRNNKNLYETYIPLKSSYVIMDACCHPDGKRLVTILNNNRVTIWQKNEKDYELTKVFIPSNNPEKIFFTQDGQRLVLRAKNSVRFSEYFNDRLVELKKLDLHHAFLIWLVKHCNMEEIQESFAQHFDKLFGNFLTTCRAQQTNPVVARIPSGQAAPAKISLTTMREKPAITISLGSGKRSVTIPFEDIPDDQLKNNLNALFKLLKKGEVSAHVFAHEGRMNLRLEDGTNTNFALKSGAPIPEIAGSSQQETISKAVAQLSLNESRETSYAKTLLAQVKTGNVERVKIFLKGYNRNNEDACAALHYAISHELDIAKLLISYFPAEFLDTSWHERNGEKWTALHAALAAHNCSLVSLLLEKGVRQRGNKKPLRKTGFSQKEITTNFEFQEPDLSQPFHFDQMEEDPCVSPYCLAAEKRCTSCMEKLEKSSYPTNEELAKSLCDAARRGNVGVVKYLLRKNDRTFMSLPDYSLEGHEKWNALHFAAAECDSSQAAEIITRLLSEDPTRNMALSENAAKDTAIVVAAQFGKDDNITAIFNFVINTGQYTKGTEWRWKKEFKKACAKGNPKLLSLIDEQQNFQFDATDFVEVAENAAELGKLAIIKYLNEKKKVLRIPASTLLARAASKKHFELVQYLLEHGWEKAIDQQEPLKARTALHYAAENADLAMVRLLLEKKAQTRIEDMNNQLPYDLAFARKEAIRKEKETSQSKQEFDNLEQIIMLLVNNSTKGAGANSIRKYVAHPANSADPSESILFQDTTPNDKNKVPSLFEDEGFKVIEETPIMNFPTSPSLSFGMPNFTVNSNQGEPSTWFTDRN